MRRFDRDDVARSAVVLAAGALLAFAAFLLLKRIWPDLDCGDDHTVVLDAVLMTMVVLAGAAVLVGTAALLTRSHVRRSIGAVVLAGALLVLFVLPSSTLELDLASYVCGVTVA